MEFNDFLNLSLAVLKDWRVIVITIIVIIFISLGNYVVKYKKKPPKFKKRFSFSNAKSANSASSAKSANSSQSASDTSSASVASNSSSENASSATNSLTTS